MNLNVFRTKRDLAIKQKWDSFSSAGDHTYATPTFEHARATPEYNEQTENFWFSDIFR